jgi:hypothetical protein
MSGMRRVKAVRDGKFDLGGNGVAVDVKVGTVFSIPVGIKINPGSWVQPCDKDGQIITPSYLETHAKSLRERAKHLKGVADAAVAAYKEADALADAAEKKAKNPPSDTEALPNQPVPEAPKPVVHTATNPVPFPKK